MSTHHLDPRNQNKRKSQQSKITKIKQPQVTTIIGAIIIYKPQHNYQEINLA
jgi:hypothetical protein